MSVDNQEKTPQILKLEPSTELVFRGPFTQVITAHLKLSNPSGHKVCFKVKTTAPKRYCVRPNSGIIESQNTVDVAVMLQPFKYDPTEKNKHRFMVQTMVAPNDITVDNLESLWKDAPADKLMDSKLKCVFDMPSDSVSGEGEKLQSKASNGEPEIIPKSDSVSHKTPGSDNISGEINTLREENKRLKESELRLRKLAIADTVRNPVPMDHMPRAGAGNSFPPIVYMIIAFLVGLIIGKFVL